MNRYSLDQIDQCIKDTCAKLNVPYSHVYSQISRHESDLAFKKALIANIPDANLINKDPDRYVQEHVKTTEELEALVKYISYLYYNYDTDVSDNAFDALQYLLQKRLKRKGRLYEKIGAEPVQRIRIQLPYPMPSLNKVRPGELGLLKFIAANQSLAWSLKLDGVSCMIVYNGGQVSKMYIRGDGNIGGDITVFKDHLAGIPKEVSKDYVVRGELMLSRTLWQEKYLDSGYSNPRGFVSGKVNSGFISQGLQDIQFVAYSILKIGNRDKVPSCSQAFKILESEKFTVPENGVFFYPTIQEIATLYVEKRKSAAFNIDGIVLTRDEESDSVGKLTINPIVANPTKSVAFKMLLEEQIRKTKVTNVEWNITRYGRYFPVAIYESVFIDGHRMHRASAHNAKHVRDWSMGVGTEIVIARSGDVIPAIKDVTIDENIEPIFPPNDKKGYEWVWDKSDIVLMNIENNRDVHIARNLHFFSTINVSGLGEKTVEKLYDSGFKTIKSIVSASEKELMTVKGIGKVSSSKIWSSIKECMSSVPIDRYFVAITGFKSSIGRKMVKKLFVHLPDAMTMSESDLQLYFKKNKIPGFGPARIKDICSSLPAMREYLYSLHKDYIVMAVKKNQDARDKIKETGGNLKIKDKKFVLSGFMGSVDLDFEDYIYLNGGDFLEDVTRDVECLIVANVSIVSKKIEKATQLEIKTLTIEEFVLRYDIDIDKFKNIEPVIEQVDEVREYIKNPKCIDDSKIPLLQHQRNIVNFIMNNRGLIIAQKMGAGKTLATVTATKCLLDADPELSVLVVSPKTLIDNFKKEMNSFGIPKKYADKYTFTTFESFLSGNVTCNRKILVFDEAHFLKSSDSKTVKKAVQCAKNAYKVLALTGTPVVNEPYDIANIVAMIKGTDPLSRSEFTKILHSQEEFDNYFKCVFSFYDPRQDFSSIENYPTVIKKNIKLIMKPAVLEKYNEIENGINVESDPWKFLSGLRKATNNIDPCQKCEWLVNLLLTNSEKTVVYIYFKSVMRKILKMLNDQDMQYLQINGEMSAKERTASIQKFNSDNDSNILIISKVGGVGIDLVGVRNVVLIDPSWNKSTEEQILSRAARYKSHSHLQKDEKNVTVYYVTLSKPSFESRKLPDFINKKSADDMMKDLVDKKELTNDQFVTRLESVSIENKCAHML